MDWMQPLYSDAPYVPLQPQCGNSTFRMRLDLSLAGRKAGVGGKINSGKTDWNNGKGPQWDVVKLGYSYDWEKC
jgi:hypothetical protein